jgi:hypothetical protein
MESVGTWKSGEMECLALLTVGELGTCIDELGEAWGSAMRLKALALAARRPVRDLSGRQGRQDTIPLCGNRFLHFSYMHAHKPI